MKLIYMDFLIHEFTWMGSMMGFSSLNTEFAFPYDFSIGSPPPPPPPLLISLAMALGPKLGPVTTRLEGAKQVQALGYFFIGSWL